jgi:hypothetical protein
MSKIRPEIVPLIRTQMVQFQDIRVKVEDEKNAVRLYILNIIWALLLIETKAAESYGSNTCCKLLTVPSGIYLYEGPLRKELIQLYRLQAYKLESCMIHPKLNQIKKQCDLLIEQKH